jgi:hypothetical protein
MLRLLVVALSLLGVACNDFEPTPPLVDVGPPLLPAMDTPENTIKRFVAVYQRKNLREFNRLFTGDYRFEFSGSADPDLANEYSAGWTREDERVAAQNLFNGGVNKDGIFQPGAQSINLDLIQGIPQDDNGDGRDPETHAVLFTPVTLTIQLPPDQVDPEGTALAVGGADPAVHRFFLVRGDAANGLDEDQPADNRHWYIWLWRDESTVSRHSGTTALETRSTSWGAVKDLFR